MISSVPSYDEELLNGAYANIGLIADKVWAYHQDDPLRKLNHSLWVQNCKLNERYCEKGDHQPRCVQDTIPGSWLAQYGNYKYNDDRERMYKHSDNATVVWQTDFHNDAITEPWMLKEVEEHFARLSSATPLLLDDVLSRKGLPSRTEGLELAYGKFTSREKGRNVKSKRDDVSRKRNSVLEQVPVVKKSMGKYTPTCSLYTKNIDETQYKTPDTEDYDKYPPPRYTTDNMAEIVLQARVTSDGVRGLWNHVKQTMQQKKQEVPQCFHQSQRNQQHPQCSRLQYPQRQHHLSSAKQQQYVQCALQHQTFTTRPRHQSSCPDSMGVARQPPPPMLSAEVPEFFPKGPINRSKSHQDQFVPLQFFPSSAERCYQDELFPYNRGHVPSGGNVFQSGSIPMQQISNNSSVNRPSQHQWIQRPNPALHIQVAGCHFPHSSVCTPVQSVCPAMIQRRIQMHDKITGNMIPQGGLASAPIPVYQKPPELYNDPSQRRKTQGVDFNNLILLTKSAMKARRNQSKNPQQSSSFILESRQPNLKSETDVLQWLEKGYPKRAREFAAVNTLVSDFRNFEYECDDSNETKNNTVTNTNNDAKEKSSSRFGDSDTSNDAPAKKRLYRDVLTNSSSSGIVLENVFDRRYDELERQAMEQYRTSEECLALRYQELEEQAMEQYRNSDNCAAGSATNNQGQIPATVTPANETQRNISKSLNCEEQSVGSQKCSGFGHCGSPIKDSSFPATRASEKGCNLKNGTPPRQPITILRPAVERGAETTIRSSNNSQCPRLPIVTKSLTALTQRFSLDSKNRSRGASGDKIDRTVQASSKRRLILMSPLESQRESEASITKTASDMRELYTFQSMNRLHISESYQDSEVIETGGGDEKITILRSSRGGTEGIRKQLFLANEELMENSWESLAVRLLEPTEKDGPCMKMSLINNPEEHVIGVTSRTCMDTSVDMARKDDPVYLLFDVLQSGWEQCEERYKIPNRLTRNKKKQCKPHDQITVNVKEPETYNQFAQSSNAITFVSREAKLDGKQIDVVSYNGALTAVRKQSEHNRKMKLKWESVSYQNVQKLAKLMPPQRCDKQLKFSDNYFGILHPMSGCMSTLCNSENYCDLRKAIGLRTHNLFGVNGYAKTYHYKSRHEAICKIHLEFTNLQILLPLYFVPIFIGQKNCYLCNRKYSSLGDRQI